MQKTTAYNPICAPMAKLPVGVADLPSHLPLLAEGSLSEPFQRRFAFSGFNPPVLYGNHGCPGAIWRIQLHQDTFHVMANGSFGNTQLNSNLFVAQSFAEKLQNFELTAAQGRGRSHCFWCFCGRRVPSFYNQGDRPSANPGIPLNNCPQGADQNILGFILVDIAIDTQFQQTGVQ